MLLLEVPKNRWLWISVINPPPPVVKINTALKSDVLTCMFLIYCLKPVLYAPISGTDKSTKKSNVAAMEYLCQVSIFIFFLWGRYCGGGGKNYYIHKIYRVVQKKFMM